jgi:hypothetical protein
MDKRVTEVVMSSQSRGAKQEVKCASCNQPFMVRVADIKRGWGKFCSKSCKAIKQEQRTGQYGAMLSASRVDFDDDPSWDSHKCA